MNLKKITAPACFGSRFSLSALDCPLSFEPLLGFGRLLADSGCFVRCWDEPHLSGEKTPRLEGYPPGAFEALLLSIDSVAEKTVQVTSAAESIDPANPWQLAGIGHTLVFASFFPDIQRAQRVVALGDKIRVEGDERALVFGGDDHERYVTLGFAAGPWTRGFSFLLWRPA